MLELEICVDSLDSAIAAQAGGADRIELCSNLAEGGVTPSLGFIRAVRKHLDIGIHVMIRPRGADFLYSKDELEMMLDDIQSSADAGADGVVLGLLTAEGDIDIERTRLLVRSANKMQVTFHRAFDLSNDLEEALEAVIRTGAGRLLTSGGEQTALLGRERIETLVGQARGRIDVMICGGIRPNNVREIANKTQVNAIHAALRSVVPSPMLYRKRNAPLLGSPDASANERLVLLPEDVRELRMAMVEVAPERLL